jgi:SAM-dependent methyltransferase
MRQYAGRPRRTGIEGSKVGRMQDTLVAPGSYRGAPVPWWVKIGAKLLLSRLPVPHALWSKINIFRHSYSSGEAELLVRAAQARVAWFCRRTGRIPHTILELGPGEITTCAPVYRALGIERTIFVDVGDFGSTDVAAYAKVAAKVEKLGLTPPDLRGAADRAEVFARCGVTYYTHGFDDLRSLPDASIDLVTSIAVIEHIRRCDLAPTFAELSRIMKDDGLAWHAVDFQDHLGGKLDNLRLPPALWESRWMLRSGFYTNRASASHIVALLRQSGLDVCIEERSLWQQPPIGRPRLARDLLSEWSDEDLRICSMRLSACAGQRALKPGAKCDIAQNGLGRLCRRDRAEGMG